MCNYLLLLYARTEGPGAEAHVSAFLDRFLEPRRVDLDYGLRVCLSHDLKAAAVRIYAALGMHEDAVRLALQVRPKLLPALLGGEGGKGGHTTADGRLTKPPVTSKCSSLSPLR